jgi:hypothetical protein
LPVCQNSKQSQNVLGKFLGRFMGKTRTGVVPVRKR